MSVQVPKTAGHEDAPFYPQSLERGRRSVMLVVAEMYIKGGSTREVEAVMREFGIERNPKSGNRFSDRIARKHQPERECPIFCV